MRAINLSEALANRGHDVVLWSADFDHFTKQHRFGKQAKVRISKNLEIRLIPSRGYKSHFGVARLFDHAQLGINLRRMLRGEIPPNVAFVGYPPIEPAWVMIKWLNHRNTPSILDVKDAWPEILLRAFPKTLQKVASILLIPYFIIMRSTFKNATYLSSISKPFLDWALNNAGRNVNNLDSVNFLTGNRTDFTEAEIRAAENYWDSLGIKANNAFRCSYIGTLTNSLNFERVIEAATVSNLEIVIAGAGPNENSLKKASDPYPNVRVTGWINSAQAFVLASRSTFMLAPYADLEDFKLSLPNKFLDAMSHSRPILTSLPGFASKFIEENGIGRSYSNSEPNSLKSLIEYYIYHLDDVIAMGLKAGNLFEQQYSGQIVYSQLIETLLKASSVSPLKR